MKRYSKKRQAIIDYLTMTREHPSAEMVYEKLKPSFPDLSLGTVYRNLKELSENGTIMSVGLSDDKERFDGNSKPHFHIICEKCGKIDDLFEIAIPDNLTENAEMMTGYEINSFSLKFNGICKACREMGMKNGKCAV